jgi:hypothetical protein
MPSTIETPPIVEATSSVHLTSWSCIYTNALSLRNKIQELSELAVKVRPLVICITETWLNPDISDNEVSLPGYMLIRSDRVIGKGGGVAIYINTKLSYKPSEIPELQNLPESLWIRIRGSGDATLLVGLVYRPPSAPESWLDYWKVALRKATSVARSPLLVLGDFNFPEVNFETGQANSRQGAEFLSIISELGLIEHVQQTTRWRNRQSPSRLDLLLSNEPQLVEALTLGAPLGASDHAVVSFKVVSKVTFNKSYAPTKLDFRGANYNAIRNQLSDINWTLGSEMPSLDCLLYTSPSPRDA